MPGEGVQDNPIMGVSPGGGLFELRGAHPTLSAGCWKHYAARRRPTAPRTGRGGVRWS